MKVAFITGITGQDGSYLAELLLEKNYKVHGLIRRSSNINTQRINHIFSNENLKLHYGDMTDGASLYKILNEIKKLYSDLTLLEVYNLAAQSHVKISFEMPEYTADTDGFGTLKLLEAILNNNLNNVTRFYQASTSELFGSTPPPQNELSKFQPRSPYAAAKLYAYWTTVNYRDAYNLHATNGILFNHESPRRGETFVTRKITRAVANIANGSDEKLYLGNLDAIRDWGYAKEYVESMWRMLQQDEPDDYVVATGVGATVREFCVEAFSHVNLDWEKYVIEDSRYLRPTEVSALVGDPTKAKKQLNWSAKTLWRELADLMVDADIDMLN